MTLLRDLSQLTFDSETEQHGNVQSYYGVLMSDYSCNIHIKKGQKIYGIKLGSISGGLNQSPAGPKGVDAACWDEEKLTTDINYLAMMFKIYGKWSLLPQTAHEDLWISSIAVNK